jgi:hypothetical protein
MSSQSANPCCPGGQTGNCANILKEKNKANSVQRNGLHIRNPRKTVMTGYFDKICFHELQQIMVITKLK